ncbi:MAG: hypothetical protein JO337_10340, partial [Acidimicrobiales bacterium]|nr:hypothetical protein [Acidimicrobiales bacterium]
MRKPSIKLACLAASVAAIGGLGVFTPAAFAAGSSGSAAGQFIPLGPFPGTPGPGCPADITTDIFGLAFVSGNANKSGETIEGDAYLADLTLKEYVYF